jgi:Fic family protein
MEGRNIENFKAGIWQKQFEYKSFLPNKICFQWIISDPEINYLNSRADRYIGRLDAFSDRVPDIDFFLTTHIAKEATVSSKIEGTQTSIEDAFISEEDIDPEKRDDWIEVQNYIKAINQAMIEMKKLPISSRLITNTHKILLDGARGKEKLPGEFRKSQNWIGKSLKEAIFVPPIHQEVNNLMSDLEKFIHSEELPEPIYIPHLIKIAIIHYQFETIHPFLDGNGRIGRVLITLYLVGKEILKSPILYLSDFFERNRRDYYDNLTEVRTHNDIKKWIKFFLQGVIETSKKGVDTFDQILKIRDRIELVELVKLGRRQEDARRLINQLYKSPLVRISDVEKILSVHNSTANRLVTDLEKLGILKEYTGNKRNRIFIFQDYISLFYS